MEKIVFKMKLHKGQKEEYKKRHDAIWLELKVVLLDSGIIDYSIYFDEKSHYLFAVMYVKKDHQVELLSKNKIVKKWWHFMADIMETATDNSPIVYELEEVFNLTKPV